MLPVFLDTYIVTNIQEYFSRYELYNQSRTIFSTESASDKDQTFIALIDEARCFLLYPALGVLMVIGLVADQFFGPNPNYPIPDKIIS
jgi:hypothetical protein